MGFWAMRTDKERPRLIMSELKSGKLRQGWGYKTTQDLREVLKAKEQGNLEPEQRETLRHLPMLGQGPNAMKKDDIVLLPNLPYPSTFSICRLDDGYDFQIYEPEGICDYGHFRPASLLRGCEGIPYSNEYVGEGLRRTLTNRGRLWRIDHLAQEVQRILSAADRGVDFPAQNGTEMRFARLLEEVRVVLHGMRRQARDCVREQITKERIGEAARAENLERLLARVLRVSFPPPATVERTGGPGEMGADIVIRLPNPFEDDEMVTVIQVKDHDGLTASEGVDQLRRAIEYYGGPDKVVQAVLATSADGFTQDALAQAKALEEDTNVKVRLVDGRRLRQVLADGLLGLAAIEDI